MNSVHRYRLYESVFILNPELSDEAVERLWERLDGVLKKMSAHEVRRESWGKRKLAFEVKKQQKGIYQYVLYLGGNDVVAELERNFRLIDDVIKFVTVKLQDDIVLDAFDFETERAKTTPMLGGSAVDSIPDDSIRSRRGSLDDDDDDDGDDDDVDDDDLD